MKSLSLGFTAAILAAAPVLLSQTAHYPNGVEGLKAASLPPPGIYFRDYNYLYFANELPDGPPDFDLMVYVQAPRLIWISDFKILGGYYGADALLPLVYQDLKVGPFDGEDFGMGDLFVEPITLSWHTKALDIGVGYGFWTPTGEYDLAEPLNAGKGYWTHMITAGATLYLDQAKTWAISALNRYEINHENPDTGITPGQAWTLEGGLSKTFHGTLDLGAVGYIQAQTTEDSGPGAAEDLDLVAGVGPEINVLFPKWMLFASARYIYECSATDRPKGHLVNITLTKRF